MYLPAKDFKREDSAHARKFFLTLSLGSDTIFMHSVAPGYFITATKYASKSWSEFSVG